MKSGLVVIITILLVFCSCKREIRPQAIGFKDKNIKKTEPLSKKQLVNWHLLDIELDTVPGISYYRAYDSLLATKKPQKTIIVAVIDGEMDIDHKQLKNTIWVNSDEILKNGKDDDNNGYIDDIHGWNFLGNTNGENNRYVNFEFTRILKKLAPVYAEKPITEQKDSALFGLYQKAKSEHTKQLAYFLNEKDNYDRLYSWYFEAKKEFTKYLGDKAFTVKELDSLKNTKTGSAIESIHYTVLIDCIENNIDDDFVIKRKEHAREMIEKLLNTDYNDRQIQGDNPDDITDIIYGNNIVNNNIAFLNHGTKTAGVISYINSKNDIKIMPLAISAYGDEHDKDIALAIRYAVDNGAHVINMSFGKEFSMYPEWVFSAIKYADQHNVLVLSSAGNLSNDLNSIDYFPNDNLANGTEVSDNFLLVGATTHFLGKELKAESSNYGNIDVDIFAPGENIYTTYPKDQYIDDFGGTSSASAVTAGVAALLLSYYPDLTARQVKHILMDSGIEYRFNVKVDDSILPFNQLSRSGKVINAYNAFIKADNILKN